MDLFIIMIQDIGQEIDEWRGELGYYRNVSLFCSLDMIKDSSILTVVGTLFHLDEIEAGGILATTTVVVKLCVTEIDLLQNILYYIILKKNCTADHTQDKLSHDAQ